jgi:polysaccharide biosynthesis transport protein
MPEQPSPGPLESVTLLVRRRWLAILVPVLLIAGAALALALGQEKRYETSTSVLFQAGSDAIPLASEDDAREVKANLGLLRLNLMKERVEARLGSPVGGEVQVVPEGDQASLATIIVTGSDPERVAKVANLYADEYIELRREVAVERAEEEQAAVAEELAALSPGQRGGPEGEALRSRLEELELAAVAPNPGVRQFNPAEPPTSAVSPKPVQNALIGAIVGLALGLGLAIALERRDRRIRDPRYLEHAFGGPIIGRIPRSRALAKAGPGTGALPPAEAEAFRTVRANLRRQLRGQSARSLLVTSAIPNEGKTTLAWNLARVEAASGRKVLLVEADMRRPVLARSLGANGTPGLSQLLSGDGELAELIQPVRLAGSDGNGGGPAGTLDVLFAGRPPTNPAELLDTGRMKALVEVLPEGYDLVVLDTPPTLVSDAMPILDRVGGVVVVGRVGVVTYDSLVELREQLDNLEAPILGVVVNLAEQDRSAALR